ncbi:Uncharacterised protein [Chlamydia trachomatis]|nr:Uncharacterised protein [Chlamydia trachomatis]CRH88143.1 Uncharacterised protein [Chlamydia trachomatis]
MNPAVSIAVKSRSRASALEARLGANPPSSPTPVASCRFCKIFFKALKTSAPIRTASFREGALIGRIINSWNWRPFVACIPPLMRFIIGQGSTCEKDPPRYRYKGLCKVFAAAFANARETPRIALAPNFSLFGVPSASIIIASAVIWSNTLNPCKAGTSTFSTLEMACKTPFPW